MKKKSIIFLTIGCLVATTILLGATVFFKNDVKASEEDFESISSTEARRGDYTVRLTSEPGNTYGFDIRKGNVVVFLQQKNPFHPSPEGFMNSNDAFNVAWWVVEKIKRTGKPPGPADFDQQLEADLSVQRHSNHELHNPSN